MNGLHASFSFGPPISISCFTIGPSMIFGVQKLISVSDTTSSRLYKQTTMIWQIL